MVKNTVRTRIAPSPTGEDIHIGNLYTALMNFAWAKKNEGQFIIRIEDTDRERFVEGSEHKILQSITNYGLSYDEGPDKSGPYTPYRQSERLELYKKYAKELIEKGKAYYCFCTKDRLDTLRKEQIAEKKTPRYDKHCKKEQSAKSKVQRGEPYVIRLDVPANETITFTDLIRGDITFESNAIDDQVLIKSDGYPTYHMAVVVDDHAMEISYVIRAEEWISSTPKHVLLYNAFGWDLPVFSHLPILRNPDKSKLSKRKNPVWASWYLSEGYLPEAVVNYLALMGWSHPEEKEIFSLKEFISFFDLKDIKPVGPVFDLVKLTWMNQQYISSIPDSDLMERLRQYSDTAKHIDNHLFEKLLPLIKSRMETLKDFEGLVSFIINTPTVSLQNDKEYEIAQDLLVHLSALDIWKKDAIMQAFKEVLTGHSVRMPVLYYILTGNERGLPLPESLEILGKDETIKRLSDLKK